MEFTTKNAGRRKNLQAFQEDLEENGLLRLRPFYKKTIKGVSLKTFIYDFIQEHNEELQTIFVNTEELQCEPGKRRSAGDIYLICKYYYPDCSLQEVLLILDELTINEDHNIKSQVCRAINKRVYSPVEDGILYHSDEKDEFNRKPGEYINEFSKNNNLLELA